MALRGIPRPLTLRPITTGPKIYLLWIASSHLQCQEVREETHAFHWKVKGSMIRLDLGQLSLYVKPLSTNPHLP